MVRGDFFPGLGFRGKGEIIIILGFRKGLLPVFESFGGDRDG